MSSTPSSAAPAGSAPSARVRLPVRSDALNDLLLWRNPIKSGAVLLVATIVYAFFKFAKLNLLVVALYALISLVLGCFLWNHYAAFSHKAPVPVPAFVSAGVTEEQAKKVAERYTVLANRVLGFLKRVFANRDLKATGQTVGILYTIARIVALISPLSIAYLVVVLSFSVPKLYELRKPQIDELVGKAHSQATRIYDQHLRQYVAKLPRASNAEPIEILEEETKKTE